MKTIIKSFFLLAITLTFFNCDNDDDATTPNVDVCNFQGLTVLLNGTQTLVPESDLTTQYLTGGSNGPEIEVFETANPGNFNFTSTVVDENTTGIGTINYGGNTYNNLTVTCQRGVPSTATTGAALGDEFRIDIVGNNIELELCVIVDVVTLGYIDADNDGCGSQTISYGFGVLNNLDTDDADPNVCL